MPGQVRDECESQEIEDAHVRWVAEQLVDGRTATRLAQTFRVLSDPTRVRILSALSHGEFCVRHLAEVLGMSHSAISHQLQHLREIRLVRFHRDGRRVYYTLDDEHIAALFQQGLAHVRHD